MSELFAQYRDAVGPNASASVAPHVSKFASKTGSRRAVAIAVGAVLLSVGGVGAAYGVSAATSHGEVATSGGVAARTVPEALTLPSRTLPVHAGIAVHSGDAVYTGDFDARVNGLVSEAHRVVAEKAEAERWAAEEAARAARAAHHRAKMADAVDSDGDGDNSGGCSGRHHDGWNWPKDPVVTP